MTPQPDLSRVVMEGEVFVMLVQGEPIHAVRKPAVAGDHGVQDEHRETKPPGGPRPLAGRHLGTSPAYS